MITAEDIIKANEALSKVDVGHGKKYVMVNERIKAFRQIMPNGSINTEILSLENGVVTMQAKIYDDESRLLASGLAQEKEQASYINKTSYIENCETSAVGRALGMLGIGVDESMASAEEVANAIQNQNQAPGNGYKKTKSTRNSNASTAQSVAPAPQTEPSMLTPELSTIDPEAKEWQDKISEFAKTHNMTTEEICKDYKVGLHTPAERLKEVYEDLTRFESLDDDEEGPFK